MDKQLSEHLINGLAQIESDDKEMLDRWLKMAQAYGGRFTHLTFLRAEQLIAPLRCHLDFVF